MIAVFPDKRSQARAPKSKIAVLLENMAPGTSGAIKSDFVAVDSGDYIWVSKRAPVIAAQEVGVTRDLDGHYHLDLSSNAAKLQRFLRVDRKLGKNEVPVTSVAWE